MMKNFTLKILIVVFGLLFAQSSVAGITSPSVFVAVNGAPIAEDDLSDDAEDTFRTGNVGLNDSDPNGDVLTFSIVSGPSNGVFTLSPDGAYTYMPNPEYVGFDYVTYQACDPSGLCDTGIIEFGMYFINDLPIANDDLFYVPTNGSRNASIATNDIEYDNEPNFWSLLTPPANAAAFTLSANGNFSFTPVPGFQGTTSFTYLVCDPCAACDIGTCTFVVAPNSPPNAVNDSHFTQLNLTLDLTVAQNDTDPNGNELTYSVLVGPQNGTFSMNSNGTYSYTPNSMWWGFEYITYQACDMFGACDQAILEIEVVFVNILPVGVGETFTMQEDGVLSGYVGANDYDPNIEPILWPLANGPDFGGFAWDVYAGTFTYSPDADFNGTEEIVYLVCDECGACVPAVLTIIVLPVNDPPYVENEEANVLEDQLLSGDLSWNDYEPDNESMTYSVVTPPTSGQFAVNTAGAYTYQPALNFFGTQTITYSVCDPGGTCSQGTLVITVEPVNDRPVAVDDSFVILEDQVLNGNAALNDTDAETASMVYTVIDAPDFGSVVMQPNGQFVYTPNANYFGSDMIVYHATDASGASDVATITISITSVNDTPVVVGETINGVEDTVVTGNVATNDSDVETSSLTYTVVTGPSSGSVVLTTNGTFTYTPAANFFGTVEVVYRATDAGGLFGNATLVINLTAVNDAPLAVQDVISSAEDVTASGTVAANDSDPEGQPLTFSFGTASNGVFSGAANGSFTFVPALNFFGSVTVPYTVCDNLGLCTGSNLVITINSVNDAPVAQNDVFTTNEDQILTGSVATNDSDIEPGDLNYQLTGTVNNGTFTMSSSGQFTYQPAAHYFGTQVVSYSVCDQQGACSSATLTLTVLSVNDIPVVVNDAYSVQEDQVLTANVSLNDSDIESSSLTYSLIQTTSVGNLSLQSTGAFIYTPPTNFNGIQTFVYRACDGADACLNATVTITVSSVNDAPVVQSEQVGMLMNTTLNDNVSLNDSDADGESLVYSFTAPNQGVFVGQSSGAFSYVPAPNQLGTVVVPYIACDASNACASGVLTISISLVNESPSLADDTYYMNEDESYSGQVGVNDVDGDGHAITYVLLDSPDTGEFTFSAAGNFTYVPPLHYSGTVTFTVRGCDLFNACSESVGTIEVQAVNDLPQASDRVLNVLEDVSETMNLATGVSDADGEVLFFTVLTLPSHGDVSITEEGVLEYNPDENFFGEDMLTYQVCDAQGACATATVAISVQFVNDFPIAQDDEASTYANQEVSGTLFLNDIELDPEPLIYSVVTAPTNGLIVLQPNGNFVYYPNDSYVGLDAVEVMVCDPCGACDISILTIQVLSANTAPAAFSMVYSGCANAPSEWSYAGYMLDAEEANDELTVSLIGAPEGFTLDASAGVIRYSGSTAGSYEFSYQVCDHGLPSMCTSAMVNIEIEEPVYADILLSEVVSPLCYGELTGSITVLASSPFGDINCEWNTGATTPNLEGIGAGIYTLEIRVETSCSGVLVEEFELVSAAPMVIEGLEAESIDETPGGSSDYTVSGGMPPYSYTWLDGNGMVISNQMVIGGLEVEGAYTLVVSDALGCEVTQNILVSGIEDGLELTSVVLYPNPASEIIQISHGANGPLRLRVYGMTGQCITDYMLNTADTQLDVSQWASGLYTFVFEQGGAVKAVKVLRN
jgi:VCBS repeat-containing protein